MSFVDVILSPWPDEPDSSGMKVRNISYTLSLNYMIGPKCSPSTERQVFILFFTVQWFDSIYHQVLSISNMCSAIFAIYVLYFGAPFQSLCLDCQIVSYTCSCIHIIQFCFVIYISTNYYMFFVVLSVSGTMCDVVMLYI